MIATKLEFQILKKTKVSRSSKNQHRSNILIAYAANHSDDGERPNWNRDKLISRQSRNSKTQFLKDQLLKVGKRFSSHRPKLWEFFLYEPQP